MFLSDKRLVQFEAIQATLVPALLRMKQDGRDRSRDLLNNFLKNKDRAILFKIGLFLVFIDVVSFFYGLSCFRKLSPSKKAAVMLFFFNSPLPLFRKGFWGINTLAKMGVYGQTEIYEEIGYKIKTLRPGL
ncbi:MAG: hypothetical protein A2X86_18620 [Bdellovibrionales bacterium GWA2_49_15]|nr:MAG: hypothetical protein A2X86_18620 [Bdellovibrionales bacterium GWA2_49_15]HAZ11539.1 hypothetical protein [Bdellovibrionales bacterium]